MCKYIQCKRAVKAKGKKKKFLYSYSYFTRNTRCSSFNTTFLNQGKKSMSKEDRYCLRVFKENISLTLKATLQTHLKCINL